MEISAMLYVKFAYLDVAFYTCPDLATASAVILYDINSEVLFLT